MRAWPWLLIVCACGDGLPDPDDGAHSGTRLRVAWFDVDGTRQWQPEEGHQYESGRFVNSERFYDKLRDETCAPEPWLDGVTRCTPDVELISRKVFADAACTVRVTASPQTYHYVGDYDDKCAQRRMWHVFPVVRTMQSATYYIAGDGKCYPLPGMTEVGVLGDELAYDTFATIKTDTVPVGARIETRMHKSDDGMRLPVSLFDALLGPSELEHADGSDSVTPQEVANASPDVLFYADADCTRGYVRVDPGCGPPQAAVADTTLYAIGDRAPSPPLYARSQGTCMPLTMPPAGELFEVLTTPVAPVAMTIQIGDEAMHRVQLQHASNGDVAFRLRELYDTALATECKPLQFPDDVYRCAPDPQAAELLPGAYADPACQTALDVVAVVPGHRQPHFALQDRRLLGGTVKIFELGAPYTDTFYGFGQTGTECLPYTGAPGDVYGVGRVVDWSELATATLATD